MPWLPRRAYVRLPVPKHRWKAERPPVRPCRHLLRDTGTEVSLTARIPARREKPSPPYARFIRLATIAAPKPLSMLTTVTLDAQLFSILRSAVSPPKLEP